jgi:hypothetical protein
VAVGVVIRTIEEQREHLALRIGVRTELVIGVISHHQHLVGESDVFEPVTEAFTQVRLELVHESREETVGEQHPSRETVPEAFRLLGKRFGLFRVQLHDEALVILATGHAARRFDRDETGGIGPVPPQRGVILGGENRFGVEVRERIGAQRRRRDALDDVLLYAGIHAGPCCLPEFFHYDLNTIGDQTSPRSARNA